MSEVQSTFNRRLEERMPTHFPGFLFKPGFQAPIKVVDIAEHGIGFFCNERLQIGDKVEIELTRNESKTFKPFTIEIEIRNRFINEQVDRYGAKITHSPEVFLDFIPKKHPAKSKLARSLGGILSS
ncbi:PilZ domain-containing protein [Thiomicrorhabdus indica]|uniref:PilZ domain-containing protein n=1 Tax=Thiomicrorhabdus indica TaxID=2267253 RepID=UPI00102DAD5A|nr:PilZ domain-containing protein [Thiomicrorhabdus indica]